MRRLSYLVDDEAREEHGLPPLAPPVLVLSRVEFESEEEVDVQTFEVRVITPAALEYGPVLPSHIVVGGLNSARKVEVKETTPSGRG